MSEAAHKVEFSRQINRMQLLFPNDFSFYPRTWILPDEYGELLEFATKEKKSPTFILKPDGGSQGDGIFLTQNVHDVHMSTALAKSSVVQEYIAEPYLLEKFKFDLRIYVVLKSLEPLQVYICREGMARFCTEHYQPPTPKNIFKTYMHLTNYSLNKHSPRYIQSDAGDKGSKRKLSAVFRQLEKEGCNIHHLWAEIDKVACQTIIAILPILKLQNQIISAEMKRKLRSFQILGFDILLDKDLKPILLEVNSSPSLRIDHEEEVSPGKVECFVSTTDLDIKLPIVKDSMFLAWQNRKRYMCKVVTYQTIIVLLFVYITFNKLWPFSHKRRIIHQDRWYNLSDIFSILVWIQIRYFKFALSRSHSHPMDEPCLQSSTEVTNPLQASGGNCLLILKSRK